MLDFLALTTQCQEIVSPTVIESVIKIESAYNPYAVAIVGGVLSKQPKSKNEALAAIEQIKKTGKRFSVGLMQINTVNFETYGVTPSDLLNPCKNIEVGTQILYACHKRAKLKFPDLSFYDYMTHAISCYYSGNFKTGYRSPQPISYVERFNKAYLTLIRK